MQTAKAAMLLCLTVTARSRFLVFTDKRSGDGPTRPDNGS